MQARCSRGWRAPGNCSGVSSSSTSKRPGLAGGAGTYAFLIGCGYFDGPTFQTRQFFMADYADERDVLRAVEAFVEPVGGLVTFNGRTFDVPLIGTRYAMHRIRSPFDELPHVDMLHPARRLWRRRRDADAAQSRWPCAPDERGRGENASCALGALERAILGFERVGDVPGAEIPGGTSITSAAATPRRSSRSSSTIVSTWSRSRP